jgi:hypothetical protein
MRTLSVSYQRKVSSLACFRGNSDLFHNHEVDNAFKKDAEKFIWNMGYLLYVLYTKGMEAEISSQFSQENFPLLPVMKYR